MYGVTEGGNSVMAHIHQFLPYLYVEMNMNSNAVKTGSFSGEDLENVKQQLCQKLQEKDAIIHIETVLKESVMGYHEEKSQFLKIYTKLPTSVAKVR